MLELDAPTRAVGFVVSPTVRCLRLGGAAALFCERRQQVFALNPTAELIWGGLAAGRSSRAVAGELEALGASAGEARRFVAESAAAWLRSGWLVAEAVVERSREPPTAEMRLRIADFACVLAFHLDRGDPLPAQAEAVFGQFQSGAGGDARLSVVRDGDGYALLVNGAPHGMFAGDGIVPQIKAVVTDGLAQAVGEGAFLLHAALLARGDDGLLITGAPGAGKTTLTMALAARGLRYGSDDIVRVSPDGAMAGVPFSPAVKSGAWDLLRPYAPGLHALPTHVRADGQAVRYAPAEMSGPVWRVRWVLTLDRRPGAAAVLAPVPALSILAELIEGGFSRDHAMRGDALEAFVGRLSGADCRWLVYSDLAGAVAAVEALVGG